MLISIRCMSCGKPIAHLWEEYVEQVKKGKPPKKILDKFGLKRYCCRNMFLTNVDLIDYAMKFKK